MPSPRKGVKRRGRALPDDDPRLRLAVEASPTAIVLVDRAGKIAFVNAKTEELFGYARTELEGRAVEVLVPERLRRGHRESRRSFFEDPRARPMGAGRDLFGVRKDGREFPIEIGLNPIQGGTFVLGSIVDISERKGSEERLRRTADDLARSNADLEQFAYAASHDLQEPLRMISSYLQLLEKHYGRRFDARGREFIGYAVQGAQHMRQLIDGLLAYSRVGMSASTNGTHATAFPAERAVQQAVQNLRAAVRESRAKVTWRRLPTVEADLVQAVELFQNLIANAIKFRGKRAPRVDIAAERKGAQWLFRVSDNGMGVDDAFAERIFGVFQRLHPRDQYPGSGIGLAICRRIVERHGGSIRLETSGPDGSTFAFTLPARGSAEARR